MSSSKYDKRKVTSNAEKAFLKGYERTKGLIDVV